MRLDELISKKDKYKSVQHTIGKRPQAKEQTTNHKAAPLPGVFLGEESILYTGKNIRRCCASGVFFYPALSDKIPSDGLFGLI